MDLANGRFTACFIGVGDKGEEIGKKLDIEFKALIKYYKQHRNDEQFTEIEGIPLLTVLSVNDSQSDQVFWEIRDKIVRLKKPYLGLFSLALSSEGAPQGHVYNNQDELLIYLDHGSEKQVVTFVKDMCRHFMFPRHVSVACWVWEIVPNNLVKIITYESLVDDIELFKQFLADHREVIKRATGLFFLISSNLPSFSLRHINGIFSAIDNAVNADCDRCGHDSLHGDEGTDYAIKVNIICGERIVENASTG
jgi:hypothetical protein